MSDIETILLIDNPICPLPCVISYTPSAMAICEVSNVPFSVDIEIVYVPDKLLLEYESFEVWLHSLESVTTTVEGLTRIIYEALLLRLGKKVSFFVSVIASTRVHAPVRVVISNGLEP